MSNQKRLSFELEQPDQATGWQSRPACCWPWHWPQTVLASENVPHRPFAYWADLPEPGQFIFGLRV